MQSRTQREEVKSSGLAKKLGQSTLESEIPRVALQAGIQRGITNMTVGIELVTSWLGVVCSF